MVCPGYPLTTEPCGSTGGKPARTRNSFSSAQTAASTSSRCSVCSPPRDASTRTLRTSNVESAYSSQLPYPLGGGSGEPEDVGMCPLQAWISAINYAQVGSTPTCSYLCMLGRFFLSPTLLRRLGLYWHVSDFIGTEQKRPRRALDHSTVTLFARFRGLSTSVPLAQAV